jgi:hypothetical protein
VRDDNDAAPSLTPRRRKRDAYLARVDVGEREREREREKRERKREREKEREKREREREREVFAANDRFWPAAATA